MSLSYLCAEYGLRPPAAPLCQGRPLTSQESAHLQRQRAASLVSVHSVPAECAEHAEQRSHDVCICDSAAGGSRPVVHRALRDCTHRGVTNAECADHCPPAALALAIRSSRTLLHRAALDSSLCVVLLVATP